MKTKYGNFTTNQIKEVKKSLRGSIFFVLFCIDPATAYEHIGIDVNQLFDSLLYKMDGGIGGYILCGIEWLALTFNLHFQL